MRRYLLALAVSAAVVTPIVADYLVIRINLGSGVPEQTASGDNSGGGIGTGGGGAAPSGGARGGGKSGFGAGGGGGAGQGLSGPGGNLGAGGPGGGLGAGGPGGNLGAGGPGGGLGAGGPGGGLGAGGSGGRGPQGPGGGGIGAGGPGGNLGAGAGGGLGAGGPGGGPGMGSGGRGGGRGGLGAGGGVMGSGLGGGPGGGLGFGAGAGAGGESNADRPTSLLANKGDLFIVATEVDVTRPRNGNVIIKHKWGSTVLNPETFLPERATMQIIKVGNLDSRYKAKRSEYLESGTKQYMKLAEWMLENWNMPVEGRFAMQTNFEAYLNELNSLSANLSAADKAKVDALLTVKGQLSKPAAAPKEELDLVNALLPKIGKDYKSLARGHFVVFHGSRDDKQADAKLSRLENAYNGIMYWFALQGRALPVPAKQMVCILADSIDRFKELRKMFDEAPLYSDGFYSTLDNITVLAPSRVDAGYEKFSQMAKDSENALKSYTLNFKNLLSERSDRPVLNARDDAEKKAAIVTGQIFAIAEKAAVEEGETATATMEAFRQICASTGYMPRSVLLPNWVKEGLTSIFATPKSSGDHNLPSLWSGIGGAHWLHLPLFKKMAEARKAGENATLTVDEKLPTRHAVKIGKLDVMAVVTDRGYERAEKASKDDKEFLTQKAQAEAWALTFFVAKNRAGELKKFYDELAQMPRDLELSPDVLEQAFGRAFGLLDASGDKLDKTKVEKFETDWAQYMKYANLTVETAEKSK